MSQVNPKLGNPACQGDNGLSDRPNACDAPTLTHARTLSQENLFSPLSRLGGSVAPVPSDAEAVMGLSACIAAEHLPMLRT